MPKSGWRVFHAQDIPSLFNYAHVYHYTLESLPVVEENINNTEAEENPQNTRLGHMTYKPFARMISSFDFKHRTSYNISFTNHLLLVESILIPDLFTIYLTTGPTSTTSCEHTFGRPCNRTFHAM